MAEGQRLLLTHLAHRDFEGHGLGVVRLGMPQARLRTPPNRAGQDLTASPAFHLEVVDTGASPLEVTRAPSNF